MSSLLSLVPDSSPNDWRPLRRFVSDFGALLARVDDEPTILHDGADLLKELIADDGWLPEDYTRPHPDRYQQYLLHCDSQERFSVVSFVWGPGQSTPVHDHRVWGLVGVLRGAEKVERFARDVSGQLHATGDTDWLREGQVDAVSPSIGDIHRVSNGREDAPSVSIHVYGANIGGVERATYGVDGRPKLFISGYANDAIPNIWDRSI